jgi:hypothetical protein
MRAILVFTAVAALAVALATASTIVGCAGGERTRIARPAVVTWPASAQQLDFFDALRAQPIVSNADAVHALLLFAGAEASGVYREEIDEAVALGWIDPAAGRELMPNESVRLGLVMTAIARISGLRLGAASLVVGDAGWSPGSLVGAAAVKRGRRLGMTPDRSANQSLTGPELTSLLRRAEMYEAARAASEMGGPGGRAPLPGG